MPDLDEKIYSLDTRVSEVEKGVAAVNMEQTHYNERAARMEKTVVDHMEKEEIDRVNMEAKMDGLLRYKWILFGMMLMMWLTSGENQILQFLKAIH